jgi:predicted P-loop ATPase
MNIGFYNKITNLKRDNEIPVDMFLESIRTGKWQDEVFKVRLIKDKKERKFEKEKLPSVTMSGLFTSRRDTQSEKHSGFIGMDIDDVAEPDEIKEILKNDPYIYAIFVTVSGNGLCVIFKINPKRHREDFYAISKYLYDKYQLVTDPSGVNESRIRYVSFDPHLFIRYENVKTFDIKYDKEKKIKIPDVVFSKKDFDRLLDEIINERLNLCENYTEWLRIGFSFVHQFQEQGRPYFHTISQFSSKYHARSTDMQYDACLKAQGFNTTTIATFYFYCKQAGLTIYTNETKVIAHSMHHGKKAGLSKNQIAKNLKEFEDIDLTEEEIDAHFNSNAKIKDGDSILEELEIWIRQNYSLKRNEISRYIENEGIPMKQKDYNSIYIDAKKIIPELSYELIDRLINSDFVPDYNPFKKFIESHSNQSSTGHIEKLFSSITTVNNEYLLKFGTKWLVSIIASIYGEHSPLMFVLCGSKQNTGKTEFFRRLLPSELQRYYAESKLDAGKDDEILMTQKLIIMDDEMGGKNKKEDKRLKELISKQTFSLREPYGRHNVELNRIAVLCGTTNDEEILFDTTGNRRIIPIHVDGIKHQVYNEVDKTSLFMEIVQLYKEGYNWQLTFDDIIELSSNTQTFEATSLEGELLDKYFTHGEELLTSTEIKIIIEKHSGQKIYLDKLCKELKRKNFEQIRRFVRNSYRRCYKVANTTIVDGVNRF